MRLSIGGGVAAPLRLLTVTCRLLAVHRCAWIYLFVFACAVLPAQHGEENPFDSHEALTEGRLLYRTNCGVCHGMEGRSGRGARLAVREHRHGNSDAELFRIIQNGISGTEMPGLWLDEDSIWKILLVVRTFEQNAGDACELQPGDAEAGRALYFGRGGCRGCHTIGAEGGKLGPDLTYIGLNYSRDQLRIALRDPARDVAIRYRTVRVVSADGRAEGVLLNEDAYSVHMMDPAGRLRSFLRHEVESVRKPGGSLMPAYGNFNSVEMDDILAFMCTLRGPEAAQ